MELSGLTILVNVRGNLADPKVQVDILGVVGDTGTGDIKSLLGNIPTGIPGATKADGIKTEGQSPTDPMEDAAKKILRRIFDQ